jgi:hypothetical protein
MDRTTAPDATADPTVGFSAVDQRKDPAMPIKAILKSQLRDRTARRLLSSAFVGALLVGTSLGMAPNAAAADPDQDALHNEEEFALGTDPNRYDTDGDGLYDGLEVEVMFTNPLVMDSDGDGVNDGAEAPYFNPLIADTDGDGILDGQECIFCAGGPGNPDPAPAPAPVDPAPAGRPDRDGDGLYDDDETGVYGTNPDAFDTDGDGSGDGEEVYYGTDPNW